MTRGSLQIVDVRVHAAAGRDADRAVLEAHARDLVGPLVRVVRSCDRCGSDDHGRPRLVGAVGHVSMSRAGGLLVTAVSERPVGVDVASVAAVEAAPLDAFTPGELVVIDGQDAPGRERTRLWAAKEAVLKLDGRGLDVDPRVVEVLGCTARWPGADGSAREAELATETWGDDLLIVVATEESADLQMAGTRFDEIHRSTTA
jgi:4'-phosphopantetheinyl transferase